MLFITACLLTFSIAMLFLADLLSMAAIITHFFGVFTLEVCLGLARGR